MSRLVAFVVLIAVMGIVISVVLLAITMVGETKMFPSPLCRFRLKELGELPTADPLAKPLTLMIVSVKGRLWRLLSPLRPIIWDSPSTSQTP